MSDQEENRGTDENTRQNIRELGINSISNIKDDIQVLPIIGQIEGHEVLSPQTKTTKYEHVIPQLVSIEQNSNIKGVFVILNTVGGDVEAGLAIAEMINSLSKVTVSLVIGGGHSIGVPLATSSDYSFISPSATMIVHPVRMNGMIIGVHQTFEYFNKIQDRINEFIIRTSNINREKLTNFMLKTDKLLNDTGTMLVGREAVEAGLIDEVGGISRAISKIHQLIDKQNK
ncbi:ClpP family protease [Clostridium tyrobutyricum]|jgi:ATP-dependent protease ClpP protease subunit|uniref:ClpP family protease n=1 Tax=Clostridium tyrobutyricum TaxID=1519 RepID=UPI000318D141|nr:ATP-dependent Clp protease proteolytic subunit [Clostridium tyrobutyricum]MBR9647072.1 ATP-dependent Clp protease proteolytic subunit [Clostridium tyrobutyricum]MBV4414851.1 ATP-dependent Clp protease proteolytic subunit [Clostridium tyrobutyricum]MBV4420712.1 ATP-dependent Clp protease proteolytic subunit [Clostridium tyrobutyricum]MBV4423823.1 ATP-dependent Clp protease proteolytic subunit [Clostridium tyrobutyricum]MBV4426698.1 ATP-dependent Clp protease proteolytic subunit [Clostridium 